MTQFAYLLQGSPSLYIHTASLLFTTLANNPTSWTVRMQRFLIHLSQYTCRYCIEQGGLCRQLDELNAASIPEEETKDETHPDRLDSNSPFENLAGSTALLHQLMVCIGSACAKIGVP